MSTDDTFLNSQMGDYRLEEILAIGGMSRVYIGLDTRLERQAAVKVLQLNQDWVNETIIERFEREAKAVAALEHDNVITIYQYGKQDGAYFLAMQYIDGPDLRQVLKKLHSADERMPVDRAIKIMQQVAAALDFAHMAEIIHRDIKPSNILLTSEDKAVLTDFGLVLRPSVDQTLGTAFGTPRYIAPEQAVASQQATGQSDIYSLAVIMYEILTGGTPFDGETPMEIALAHVSDPPDPPSERELSVPKPVDKIMERALSKEPTDRHETATEFVNDIARAYRDAGMLSGELATTQPLPKPPAVKPKQDAPPARPPQPAAEKDNISIPSPIGDESTGFLTTPERERSDWLILGLVGVLVLAVVGGGLFVFGGSGSLMGGGQDVVLFYNSESFVLYNASDEPLTDTLNLDFVRGRPGEGDDFNGDRIPRDTVPPGECFRIAQTGREALEPSQCDDIDGEEILSNVELFFWRTEPVNQASFEVRWEDNVVARCDTVQRGDVGECRLTLPTEPDADDSDT